MAGCIAALAIALALPASARAGWPLASTAPCALGFGATYSATDGTPSTHRGADLPAAAGSTVLSPMSGRVSFAGRVPGTGGGTVLAVTIAGANSSVTLMPLSSADVKTGSELAEGEVVGALAGSGDASSAESHLHVGARKGDLYIDPLSLMAVPAAGKGSAPDGRLSPSTQPKPAPAPGAAAVSAVNGPALAETPVSAPGASALQPQGVSALGGAPISVGARAGATAPGARVAPGVSVAGAVEEPGLEGGAMQSASEALAAAVSGASRGSSSQGVPAAPLVEWLLGMAARGLQTGARVLAAVLLALGALWPIWRSERRKGAVELSVRPLSDDVAAVTGR
jgi:hypothetical protein